MKGVVLAGGTGSRLHPLTLVTNKHLMPVHDRPMIYFPLQTLAGMGIREVMVILGGRSIGDIVELLADGRDFGLDLTYRYQRGSLGIAHAIGLTRDFVGEESFCVVLGDNVLRGDPLADVAIEFEAGPWGGGTLLYRVEIRSASAWPSSTRLARWCASRRSRSSPSPIRFPSACTSCDPTPSMSSSTQVIGRFGAAQINVYERGPLQASLLVERSFEGSTWLQQIILRHGEAELEIRNWLQWQGRWRLLKLAFAVPVHGPRSVHDVPFGWCERPCDGREVPVQMWSDVFGSALAEDGRVIGLAVLNDGKYGYDVSDSTLRVTVLRSPPYAYHEPHAFGSKGRYDWIDQGGQEFTLVLRPHVGDWRDAGIVGRARTLNLPAVPITMHGHPGSRPPVDSLLELTCNDMELTALKPAEDGDGYIARLADRHGRGGQGELRWRGERFPVRVGTLRGGYLAPHRA